MKLHKPHKSLNQKTVGNQILRALPPEDWSCIEPHLESVEWPMGTMIHDAGTPVDFAAFPNAGLLSAVLLSNQNVNVEVGMASTEGLDGVSGILADVPSMPLVTVQVPGHGLLLPAAVLREEWQRSAALRQLIVGYSDVAATQSAQSALCNRVHTVEERLSRWLLLVQDRVGSDSFELASVFIAALLGVRLTGVPVALGVLQQAGIIKRTLDSIVILDREQLESSACECYAILRDRYTLWEQTLSAASAGQTETAAQSNALH